MTTTTPFRLHGATQDRKRLGRAVGLCLDWLHRYGQFREGRERRDSGEIFEEECLDWKRGFSGAGT